MIVKDRAEVIYRYYGLSEDYRAICMPSVILTNLELISSRRKNFHQNYSGEDKNHLILYLKTAAAWSDAFADLIKQSIYRKQLLSIILSTITFLIGLERFLLQNKLHLLVLPAT